MFLVYGSLIFVYSVILQLLSIVFKYRVGANVILRLKEDPSPISTRKEFANGTDDTSHEDKDEGETNNRDDTLGKAA